MIAGITTVFDITPSIFAGALLSNSRPIPVIFSTDFIQPTPSSLPLCNCLYFLELSNTSNLFHPLPVHPFTSSTSFHCSFYGALSPYCLFVHNNSPCSAYLRTSSCQRDPPSIKLSFELKTFIVGLLISAELMSVKVTLNRPTT